VTLPTEHTELARLIDVPGLRQDGEGYAWILDHRRSTIQSIPEVPIPTAAVEYVEGMMHMLRVAARWMPEDACSAISHLGRPGGEVIVILTTRWYYPHANDELVLHAVEVRSEGWSDEVVESFTAVPFQDWGEDGSQGDWLHGDPSCIGPSGVDLRRAPDDEVARDIYARAIAD